MKWAEFYDGLRSFFPEENLLESIAWDTAFKVNLLGTTAKNTPKKEMPDRVYISKEGIPIWILKVEKIQAEDRTANAEMIWTIEIKKNPPPPPGFKPGIHEIKIVLDNGIWCHNIDHLLLDEEAPDDFPNLDHWDEHL